jgi:tetratricopeptide (TPR) repeat protein
VLDEILADGPAGIVVVPGHGDFLTGEDLVRLRELAAERLGEARAAGSAARFLADRGERGAGAEGGRLAAALAELETALRDQPDRYVVDQEELALLGQRWLGRGRTAAARRLLEWAVAREPDSALLWSVVAEARWRDGDAPAAEQAYLKTLESVPRHRGAAEGLEWLRMSAD